MRGDFPTLASDVVLGPVLMETKEEQARYSQKANPPAGAVLARTSWTDRDHVMQHSQDQLGLSTHCLMVRGRLRSFMMLQADGTFQILVEHGEEGDPDYRVIFSGIYEDSLKQANIYSEVPGVKTRRGRRRHSAVNSVE